MSTANATKQTQLLKNYYGEYFSPIHWESGKKSRNFFAKIKKGNRPSYIKAAKPDTAIPLYNQFIKTLNQLIPKEVQTGEFGAYMKISLVNDGPVTIYIDTKNKE